jgi:hypothetical protein
MNCLCDCEISIAISKVSSKVVPRPREGVK